MSWDLEALYGGAAGGGKSAALLMAALQCVDVPGYAALILRESYPELTKPGALIALANDWLRGTDATWNGRDYAWSFPSGATLQFGYLQHEDDKYNYKSAQFQFVGFDELTQFSESQYTYLFSRLRRPKGTLAGRVPLRMRAATNPGGPGHDWVFARFPIDEAAPDGIARDASSRRVFVPALLEDNPGLDVEAYERSLSEMRSVEYEQLRHGRWIKASGGRFKREYFSQILDTTPPLTTRARLWDLAATVAKPGTDPDWTVGALIGWDAQRRLVIADMRRMRSSPADVEAAVKQAALVDGAHVPIWIEEEPGAAGKSLIDHYQRRILSGHIVRGWKPTGDKQVRAQPLEALAERGNVLLVRGDWINAFLDEAEAFPHGSHDDMIDAASMGVAVLSDARPARSGSAAKMRMPRRVPRLS